MRKPTLIMTVMAAALLTAPASPQDRGSPPRKDQAEESAKRVKELQRERIATLKALADATTRLAQNGRGSPDEAYEARWLLLKAELDAAEKESDRITLYKGFVDDSQKLEALAEEMVRTGRGTLIPALKIKARRLEVQIDLERAKARVAKEAR